MSSGVPDESISEMQFSHTGKGKTAVPFPQDPHSAGDITLSMCVKISRAVIVSSLCSPYPYLNRRVFRFDFFHLFSNYLFGKHGGKLFGFEGKVLSFDLP